MRFESPVQHRRTVLVIEDDPSIALLLTDLLPDDDYTVLHAPDGESGVQLAARSNPSALLIGPGPHRLAGPDVLDTFRADDATRHIPMILVGRPWPADDRANQSDAEAVVDAPFEIRDLLAHVERATALAEAAR
jgi:DNA-binding response OmpR family regulator